MRIRCLAADTAPPAMRWLYRAQTRLGLTGPEGTAALVLLTILTAGGVAHHLQASAEPIPPDFYAAADAAFANAANARADSASTDAPAPLALFAAPDSVANDSAAADTSAAMLAEAEVEEAAAPRRTSKPPPAPTNLNTASEQELLRLPRIGPALAARIVEHRRVHGPFRHPDEITEVRGIGEKTLEKLRPWIHL